MVGTFEREEPCANQWTQDQGHDYSEDNIYSSCFQKMYQPGVNRRSREQSGREHQSRNQHRKWYFQKHQRVVRERVVRAERQRK